MGIGAILIPLKRWKWGQLAAWVCTRHLYWPGRWISFHFRVLRRVCFIKGNRRELNGIFFSVGLHTLIKDKIFIYLPHKTPLFLCRPSLGTLHLSFK